MATDSIKSLDELDRQIAQLQAERQQQQRALKASAIEAVRKLIIDNGLTMADIGNRVFQAAESPVRSGRGGKTGSVKAKYINQATGETWSGRGLQPKWLKAALNAGAKIEDFAVDKAAPAAAEPAAAPVQAKAAVKVGSSKKAVPAKPTVNVKKAAKKA